MEKNIAKIEEDVKCLILQIEDIELLMWEIESKYLNKENEDTERDC